MISDTRLGFIGSGIMAEAFLQGLLRGSLVDASRIRCSDPFEARLRELEQKFGIRGTASNLEVIDGADIIVLSIKPQVLKDVLAELKGKLKPDQLIISIIAGAPMGGIARGLGHQNVVRSMPNTPARIGMGMTVWTMMEGVNARDRDRARAIFAALGEEVFVDHEEYLDMATALSGTGPAYFFLMMEALIDAGVHMGFSRRVAQQLVLKTMQGSVEFARQATTTHPAELRNMVTSPGGTTAEALYELEKGGMRTVISRAVYAAYQKSRRLSQAGFDVNGTTTEPKRATS